MAQFEVFEESYQADQRETTRNNLDLSDVDALLQHLKESVIHDGFTNQFIQTMHYLMTIPGEETMGEQMWNNVQYIVHLGECVGTHEWSGSVWVCVAYLVCGWMCSDKCRG